jgi:putative methyltransferase (TIGR04325 family)
VEKAMIREVMKAALESKSIQNLLVRVDQFRYGRELLNKFSSPRGIFDTFEQASNVASKTGVPGHENPGNAETHLAMSTMLLISDYPVLYWMNQAGRDLRVLDYGGNVGNLFYAYRNYLNAEKLEWVVLDLPKMVETGRAIAADRGVKELQLFPSTVPFPNSNFVLLSGAYHYWQGTASDFVKRFEHPPEHILINRTPLVDGDVQQHTTVQFSQYSALPCILRNKKEVVASFQAEGYRLIDAWCCPEYSVKKALFPRQSIKECSALYFKRK